MVTDRYGGNGTVTVYYLQSQAQDIVQSFAAFRDFPASSDSFGDSARLAATSAPTVAAIGDVQDDGSCDLVVGQAGAPGQQPPDSLEMYHISPDGPTQLLARLAAFDHSGLSSSSNFVVGDVDPSVPGDEVVVGEDGSRHRASRVRVFGGFATGNARLLFQFRAVPSAGGLHQRLPLALGNVLSDAAYPGKSIVSGDTSGRVYVFAVHAGRATLVRRYAAFPDAPRTSARNLAVGDLLSHNPGDEIVVGDDGTRQDGLVRVLDGRTGQILVEFETFDPGEAAAGVELWVADVIPGLPGAELIAAANGKLRVFSLAGGTPQHVLDLANPVLNTTNLRGLLAVGQLLPDAPGNEVALATTDPGQPVQVFNLDESGATLMDELTDPNTGTDASVGTIAIAP